MNRFQALRYHRMSMGFFRMGSGGFYSYSVCDGEIPFLLHMNYETEYSSTEGTDQPDTKRSETSSSTV